MTDNRLDVWIKLHHENGTDHDRVLHPCVKGKWKYQTCLQIYFRHKDSAKFRQPQIRFGAVTGSFQDELRSRYVDQLKTLLCTTFHAMKTTSAVHTSEKVVP